MWKTSETNLQRIKKKNLPQKTCKQQTLVLDPVTHSHRLHENATTWEDNRLHLRQDNINILKTINSTHWVSDTAHYLKTPLFFFPEWSMSCQSTHHFPQTFFELPTSKFEFQISNFNFQFSNLTFQISIFNFKFQFQNFLF